MLINKLKLGALVFGFAAGTAAFSASPSQPGEEPAPSSSPVGASQENHSQQPRDLRVGGTYKVSAIDRVQDHFRVEFTTVAPSGKFDVLYLESDHIHFAVRLGDKLRISAEILSANGSKAEVAQMLVFLPHSQGPVPVWLLSNRSAHLYQNHTRYLDQHAPIFDYLIL